MGIKQVNHEGDEQEGSETDEADGKGAGLGSGIPSQKFHVLDKVSIRELVELEQVTVLTSF